MKIEGMTLLLLFVSTCIVFGLVRGQLYSCNGYSVLIDYSNVSQTNFLNLYTYFSEASNPLNSYTIKTENLDIDISGDFGSVYFDLNANYIDPKSVDPEVVIYSCKSLRFLMPSLSRFWNSITDMELIVSCLYSKDSKTTSKFSFAQRINLVIPILQLDIENVISAPILNTLVSTLSNYIANNDNVQLVDSANKLINRVSIQNDILQVSNLKSNIQFYLYNYYSMDNCNKQDSYLVFNNFLKISKSDFTILNNHFTSLKLLTTEFYKTLKYETNIPNVLRNFEINYTNNNFEEKIISYFDNYMSASTIFIAHLFLFLLIIL